MVVSDSHHTDDPQTSTYTEQGSRRNVSSSSDLSRLDVGTASESSSWRPGGHHSSLYIDQPGSIAATDETLPTFVQPDHDQDIQNFSLNSGGVDFIIGASRVNPFLNSVHNQRTDDDHYLRHFPATENELSLYDRFADLEGTASNDIIPQPEPNSAGHSINSLNSRRGQPLRRPPRSSESGQHTALGNSRQVSVQDYPNRAEKEGELSTVNNWGQRCRCLRTDEDIELKQEYIPPKLSPDVHGYTLDIVTTTWIRDSHDLFDYEAQPDRIQKKKQRLFISASTLGETYLVLRVKYRPSSNDPNTASDIRIHIRSMSEEESLSEILKNLDARAISSVDVLMQIKILAQKGDDNLTYYAALLTEPSPSVSRSLALEPMNIITKDIFEIVRDLERPPSVAVSENGLEIIKGMHIKLGRYPVKVKQLVVEGSDPMVPEMELLEADKKAIESSRILLPEETEGLQCRICLGEGGDLADPLVSACQCRGSIQYIHATCLRYWFQNNEATQMQSQGDQASAPFTQCNIKATFCELCKSQFPPYLLMDCPENTDGTKERFDLCTINKLQPPFLVLESLQQGNARIYANTLLQEVGQSSSVTDLDDSNTKPILRIGRGHESSMRIPDVSISRVHTEVALDADKKRFTLKDLGSKFGTLIKLDAEGVVLGCCYKVEDRANDELVFQRRRVSIQSGRSVVDCILQARLPGDTPKKRSDSEAFG